MKFFFLVFFLLGIAYAQPANEKALKKIASIPQKEPFSFAVMGIIVMENEHF